jgi:hypothetical protein
VGIGAGDISLSGGATDSLYCIAAATELNLTNLGKVC